MNEFTDFNAEDMGRERGSERRRRKQEGIERTDREKRKEIHKEEIDKERKGEEGREIIGKETKVRYGGRRGKWKKGERR